MAVSKGETVTCGSVSFFAIIEIMVAPLRDNPNNYKITGACLKIYFRFFIYGDVGDR